MSDDKTSDLVTAREAAEAAGVTAGRIRQVLLAGELRGRKLGWQWVIARAELDRWLEARRNGRSIPGEEGGSD